MKKIAFLCLENPLDKKKWSGTLNSSYCELSKIYDVYIVEVDYNNWMMGVIKLLYRSLYLLTGKTYLPIYSSRSLSKKLAKKADTMISKINPDCIFAIAASTIVPFIKTTKPIIYMSDSLFDLMLDYYFFNLNKKNIQNGRFYEERTLKRSDKVIYASDWARNGAHRIYGTDYEKMYTVPLGANITPLDDFILNPIEETVRILFIGADWKRKGGDIAVSTIYLLNTIDKEHRYILEAIGGRPEYPIDEEIIHIHGFIDKNTKEGMKRFTHIVDSCQISILPTKAECAGIAFAEASSRGIPTITYDTGGVGTYITSSNGILLKPEAPCEDFVSAIISLVQNKETYTKLCKSTYKTFIEKYTWEKWRESVSNIIDCTLKD